MMINQKFALAAVLRQGIRVLGVGAVGTC